MSCTNLPRGVYITWRTVAANFSKPGVNGSEHYCTLRDAQHLLLISKTSGATMEMLQTDRRNNGRSVVYTEQAP